MHVNISGRDLAARSASPRTCEQVLARHQACCRRSLALEITETTLMGQLDPALAHDGTACATAGVRFSIDDFGTGYSSLAYLGTAAVRQPEDRPQRS
jgi:EAL domain-containing protein (putative c-di-GMP-specific phosphodiesterase class I)